MAQKNSSGPTLTPLSLAEFMEDRIGLLRSCSEVTGADPSIRSTFSTVSNMVEAACKRVREAQEDVGLLEGEEQMARAVAMANLNLISQFNAAHYLLKGMALDLPEQHEEPGWGHSYQVLQDEMDYIRSKAFNHLILPKGERAIALFLCDQSS